MRAQVLAARISLLVVALGACSSPPSGQGKRTVLLTEGDGARAGEEASAAVEAQMGLLGDPQLDAYVNEIGERLLRGVPRLSFRYQFKVVDQFEPNAFALPGGYVFISRGLLALASSEDEIACVIGHEITHITRHHAALQQVLAARGGPLTMPWIRAANMAAYGRDMEREADRGGQILAAAAGYDPMGMSSFLAELDQMERMRIGHARQQSFFDTHPGSGERAAVNAARSYELRWQPERARGDTRAGYLHRLEGLPVGPRPEGGLFEGDLFLHPDMGFQISFPPGWRTSNTNRAVGAMSPQGDALVYVMAGPPSGDPRQTAEAFVEETRRSFPIDVVGSQPVKIGEVDAWRLEIEGGRRGGDITALVTFVPHGGAIFRITAVAPSHLAKQYAGRMLNTMRSFRPLPQADQGRFHVTRIHLVPAHSGEELLALGRRSQNHWDVSTTAVYNGIFSNHRFQGGELVKTARAEPYVPARRGVDASRSGP